MSSITIRAATVADSSVIARIHYDALDQFHEFYAALFKIHPRDSLPISSKEALEKGEHVFLVAEDAASEVVGWVRYHTVDAVDGKTKDVVEKEKKEDSSAAPAGALWAPKEHLKDLWDRFCERTEEVDSCYEKGADGKRHIYVKHIMVDPAHQRKGIGAKLLSTVLAQSDAEGLPTFIESSGEGYSLYSRLGFVPLATWTIDNGKWAAEVAKLERELGIKGNEGLEERYRNTKEVETYMVRQPKRI